MSSNDTRAQRNQSLAWCAVSSRAVTVAVSAPGGRVRRAHRRRGLSSAPKRVSRRAGVATDADVAVEEKRRPPRTGARQFVEDRADDRAAASVACEIDRDGREVDAEREHAATGERVEVSTGAATDIEHRSADRAQQHFVGVVGRSEPARQRERRDRAVAEAQNHADRRRAPEPCVVRPSA